MKTKIFTFIITALLILPSFNVSSSETNPKNASGISTPITVKYDNITTYRYNPNIRKYTSAYVGYVIIDTYSITIYIPGIYGTSAFGCTKTTNNKLFNYCFFNGWEWLYFNL